MAIKAIKKKKPAEDRVTDAKLPSKRQHATTQKSRNIAAAYEPVELTAEDAEVLRQVSANAQAPAGRPARPPRKMADRQSFDSHR